MSKLGYLGRVSPFVFLLFSSSSSPALNSIHPTVSESPPLCDPQSHVNLVPPLPPAVPNEPPLFSSLPSQVETMSDLPPAAEPCTDFFGVPPGDACCTVTSFSPASITIPEKMIVDPVGKESSVPSSLTLLGSLLANTDGKPQSYWERETGTNTPSSFP